MLVPACGSRCAREGSSSEVEPARGKRGRSSEAEPARGRRGPSSDADLARGGREPSSEADLARGDALLGRSDGPRGPPWRGLCRACFVLGLRCVCVLCFFAGFKQDSPGFLGDPRGCPLSGTALGVPLNYGEILT
jgi:hypothetical protein